jgi:hypothetical protein
MSNRNNQTIDRFSSLIVNCKRFSALDELQSRADRRMLLGASVWIECLKKVLLIKFVGRTKKTAHEQLTETLLRDGWNLLPLQKAVFQPRFGFTSWRMSLISKSGQSMDVCFDVPEDV